jgi:hypothetical protein
MRTVRIDCVDKDWKMLLKKNLQDGDEVDLIDFDYTLDGPFCEMLAIAHSMRFTIRPESKAGFFKKN